MREAQQGKHEPAIPWRFFLDEEGIMYREVEEVEADPLSERE